MYYDLSALAADTSRQLDVFGHDGDTFGVDGAKVGVLEQTYEICLAGLLQRHDGGALETQIGLEILSDLADQALEGQLADEEFRALLVTSDFTESHRSGPVTMGFLHASGGGRALPRRLGGELFAGSLSSGGFSGSLLGASHCLVFFEAVGWVVLESASKRAFDMRLRSASLVGWLYRQVRYAAIGRSGRVRRWGGGNHV